MLVTDQLFVYYLAAGGIFIFTDKFTVCLKRRVIECKLVINILLKHYIHLSRIELYSHATDNSETK